MMRVRCSRLVAENVIIIWRLVIDVVNVEKYGTFKLGVWCDRSCDS